jgi:8-amino-7-oxononanoate synthase
VIDMTSSLYLGLRHESASLGGWTRLTTGVPADLSTPHVATSVARTVAGLVGTPAATLVPSTLHAFWDLFAVMRPPRSPRPSRLAIHVDAGTYPIARWGIERAACLGAVARTFGHHDPTALSRSLNETDGIPVVVADGLCPGCGNVAPVWSYLDAVRRLGGWVVIDDTQALGILGSPGHAHPYGRGGGGVARWAGVGGPNLILVSSMAKGLGVPIASIAGSERLVQRFESRSETRMHGSPPSVVHLLAAVHALRVNRDRGDGLRRRLGALVHRFKRGLEGIGIDTNPGLFPVVTVEGAAGIDLPKIHRTLLAHEVRSVLHRSRCRGGVALSFIVTAAHREHDVDRAALVLAGALDRPAATRERVPV